MNTLSLVKKILSGKPDLGISQKLINLEGRRKHLIKLKLLVLSSYKLHQVISDIKSQVNFIMSTRNKKLPLLSWLWFQVFLRGQLDEV